MPQGNGTGPRGKGPGTGRGMRRGQGGGGSMGGNRPGAGPGGDCTCPHCGTTVPHQTGVRCFQVSCPKCGQQMVRK